MTLGSPRLTAPPASERANGTSGPSTGRPSAP